MKITITDSDSGKTIRELLRRDMNFSSAMLKKLKFSPGGITVNGGFVTVRYVLREGDVLSLALEDRKEDTSPYITPSDLPLELLYEDEHVAVINKPADMPSHPSFGHRDDTVANALAFRYAGSPYVFRPVNRLDRDTSGVMLIARSRLDAWRMYSSMTDGKIKKSYAALLCGTPESLEGERRSYMCRMEGSIVMRRECDPDEDSAKAAVTKYKTLYSNGEYSLVLASPVTGRTHQLRVAFANMGCPVAGDDMYGEASPIISRQALHSLMTVFPHPASGAEICAFAPLAGDFAAALCRVFPEAGINNDMLFSAAAEFISSL